MAPSEALLQRLIGAPTRDVVDASAGKEALDPPLLARNPGGVLFRDATRRVEGQGPQARADDDPVSNWDAAPGRYELPETSEDQGTFNLVLQSAKKPEPQRESR